VVLFLREDPLRRTHMTLQEAELLASEAEAGAAGGETPAGSAAEGGQTPAGWAAEGEQTPFITGGSEPDEA